MRRLSAVGRGRRPYPAAAALIFGFAFQSFQCNMWAFLAGYGRPEARRFFINLKQARR